MLSFRHKTAHTSYWPYSLRPQPKNARPYRTDLNRFSEFTGVPEVAEATKHLLALTHGEANALVLRYRSALIQSGLAPATTNRRLAALRSLVQLARLLGLVPWQLSVPGVEAIPYRDTREPPADPGAMRSGGRSVPPATFRLLLHKAETLAPNPTSFRAPRRRSINSKVLSPQSRQSC